MLRFRTSEQLAEQRTIPGMSCQNKWQRGEVRFYLALQSDSTALEGKGIPDGAEVASPGRDGAQAAASVFILKRYIARLCGLL